jgi:hypothetical protein
MLVSHRLASVDRRVVSFAVFDDGNSCIAHFHFVLSFSVRCSRLLNDVNERETGLCRRRVQHSISNGKHVHDEQQQ